MRTLLRLVTASALGLFVGSGLAQTLPPPGAPPSTTNPGELPETTPGAPAPPTYAPGTTTEAESAPKRVRISGGVMAGMRLTNVDPVYPPQAKAQQVQGSVVLSALISEAGTVQTLQVVSGPPDLAAAAMEAVKQWTYRQYRLNGRPVQVLTTVTVNFKLQ